MYDSADQEDSVTMIGNNYQPVVTSQTTRQACRIIFKNGKDIDQDMLEGLANANASASAKYKRRRRLTANFESLKENGHDFGSNKNKGHSHCKKRRLLSAHEIKVHEQCSLAPLFGSEENIEMGGVEIDSLKKH